MKYIKKKCKSISETQKKREKSNARSRKRFIIKLFQANILEAPGQKLCYSCKKHAESNPNAVKRTESIETSDNDCIEIDASFNKDESISSLNSSLCELGESPLTLHGLPSSSKKKYAKRKVKTAYNTMKSKVQKILVGDLPQVTK